MERTKDAAEIVIVALPGSDPTKPHWYRMRINGSPIARESRKTHSGKGSRPHRVPTSPLADE